MCTPCRQEVWFEKHGDELEFLIVTKNYTISQARLTIVKMIRPICRACNKPIKGAKEGALFHQGTEFKKCRRAYMKYRYLRRQGLTAVDALAKIEHQGR